MKRSSPLYILGLLIVVAVVFVGSLALGASYGRFNMLKTGEYIDSNKPFWERFLDDFSWEEVDWDSFPTDAFANFPWENLPWDDLPENFDWNSLPWEAMSEAFPWDKIPWNDLPEDFPWDNVPWKDIPADFDWGQIDWTNLPENFPWNDFPWDDLPWDNMPEDFPWGDVPLDALPENFDWTKIPWEDLPDDFGWDSVPWEDVPLEDLPENFPWENVPWDNLPEDFDWENAPWDNLPENFDWSSVPWDNLPENFDWSNVPWSDLPEDFPWEDVPWEDVPLSELPPDFPWEKFPWQSLGADFPWEKVPWSDLPENFPWEKLPWEVLAGAGLLGALLLPWDRIPLDKLPEGVYIPTKYCEHQFGGGSVCEICHTPRLILRSASESKEYDGAPLTAPSVEIIQDGSAFIPGMQVNVLSSASITVPSSKENYFEVSITMLGEDITDKYVIQKHYGKLEVTKCKITVRADSHTKQYDGAPLTGYYTVPESSTNWVTVGYEIVEGQLIAGHTLYASYDGAQIKPGSCMNTIAEVIIYDEAGNNVTDYYIVETEPGTLRVTR